MNSKYSSTIRRVTGIGMFSALAFLVAYLCTLIPRVAGFLSFDAKDAIIAIASFIYGPIAAPVIALIVTFLEFITFSQTGPWGFLMNFVASAVFSLTASLIYKFRKTLNGAIIGFAVAVVVTTGVMLALDPVIIPLFAPAVTAEAVISLMPTLVVFNFSKTLVNGAMALLLYKPIIGALRSAGLVPKSSYATTFNKSTVITLIVGGASLICAVVMLLFIW